MENLNAKQVKRLFNITDLSEAYRQLEEKVSTLCKLSGCTLDNIIDKLAKGFEFVPPTPTELKIEPLTEEDEKVLIEQLKKSPIMICTENEYIKGYEQGVTDCAERLQKYYLHLGSKTSSAVVSYHIEQIAQELKEKCEKV